MNKRISNEESRKFSRSENPTETIITFLIPEKLILTLSLRLKVHAGGVKEYCQAILLKLREYSDLPAAPTVYLHRKYQTPGQDLVRWNFRVDARFWMELGDAANEMGVSRCYLFVLLLQLEAQANSSTDSILFPTSKLRRFLYERLAHRHILELLLVDENDPRTGERLDHINDTG